MRSQATRKARQSPMLATPRANIAGSHTTGFIFFLHTVSSSHCGPEQGPFRHSALGIVRVIDVPHSGLLPPTARDRTIERALRRHKRRATSAAARPHSSTECLLARFAEMAAVPTDRVASKQTRSRTTTAPPHVRRDRYRARSTVSHARRPSRSKPRGELYPAYRRLHLPAAPAPWRPFGISSR